MLRKLYFSIVLGVCLLLPFLSTTPTEAADASGSTVRYAVGAQPETLDPRKMWGVPEYRIADNLFEGLTTHGPGGEIVPGTAESWTVSPDGKVYTFIIRANAKWSNGDPVTAYDFEYAWKSTLDPRFGARYAEMLYFIAGAEEYNTRKGSADGVKVEPLNSRMLRVTLVEPCPFFPSVLVNAAYYPVNKRVDQSNPAWARNAETFVSNGAFMMKSWTFAKIEAQKNPYYWQVNAVKLDQLDFILTDDDTRSLAMFNNNQVDLLVDNISPRDRIILLKSGAIKAIPYANVGYYCFNTEAAPFDNPKVRKAFSLAIDRRAIVQYLNMGQTPAFGFVPWGIPDAAPRSDFRQLGGDVVEYNPTEAQRLLAEAGYPNGKGLPPVTLIYNTHQMHKSIAEIIQAMWRSTLGVTVELEDQDWKTFLRTRQEGRYQVARHGWTGDYEDPFTFLSLFASTSGNNDAKYKNRTYDLLVAQTYTEKDPKARMALLHRLENILLDDAVVAPLFFAPQYMLAKPNLRGVIISSIGNIYFKNAYIEK